jgi:hypothetical protein
MLICRRRIERLPVITVMPGFMPGIHVFAFADSLKTWMAGTSPAMTR